MCGLYEVHTVTKIVSLMDAQYEVGRRTPRLLLFHPTPTTPSSRGDRRRQSIMAPSSALVSKLKVQLKLAISRLRMVQQKETGMSNCDYTAILRLIGIDNQLLRNNNGGPWPISLR